MISVDLKSRVIPSKQQIWALHPGIGKQFVETFREVDKVFLDLPRLEITVEDNLNNPKLRAKILRSRAWREYALKLLQAQRIPESPIPAMPSWNLEIYLSAAFSEDIRNLATSVWALLFTAKVGDIVLVPGRGGQFGHVGFAEITSDFNPADSISVGATEGYSVQYRSVRWLNPLPMRRDLSVGLAKRLENRRALIQIDRHTFGSEVYAIAYPNFSTENLSKTTIFGPNYTSKNASDIMDAIQIISWLVAAFSAIEAEKINDINELHIADFINKHYNKNIILDFGVEFNSPGIFRIFSSNPRLAIFVSASLAILSALSGDAITDKRLQITNSTPMNSTETGTDYTSSVQNLVDFIAPYKLSQLTSLNSAAKQKIGLKPSSSAQIGNANTHISSSLK